MSLAVELARYAQEIDLDTGSHTHALYLRFNSGRMVRAILMEEDMEILLHELGGPELPAETEAPVAAPSTPVQLPVEPPMRETAYGYEYGGGFEEEQEEEPEEQEEEPPPPPKKKKGKNTPKTTVLAHSPPRRTVAADENGYPVLPTKSSPPQPTPPPIYTDPYVDEDGVGSI